MTDFVEAAWGLIAVTADTTRPPTNGSPCLVTDYATDREGYAATRRGGKAVRIHVAACEWAHGEKPFPEAVVLHACDFPTCCNPLHLSWGTQLENVADRVAKGRDAKGERNGQAKIPDAERAAVYAGWLERQTKTGKADWVREQAARLGVTESTIRRVVASYRGAAAKGDA